MMNFTTFPLTKRIWVLCIAAVIAITSGSTVNGATNVAPKQLWSSDAATVIANAKPKPLSVREYVRKRASRAGWTYSEWLALAEIVYRESRWNPAADNQHSSAWGLFQMLKMKPGTPLERQTTKAIAYIKERYGSPIAALHHHDKHGWY